MNVLNGEFQPFRIDPAGSPFDAVERRIVEQAVCHVDEDQPVAPHQ